jgi:hypothetical protein
MFAPFEDAAKSHCGRVMSETGTSMRIRPPIGHDGKPRGDETVQLNTP